MRFNSEIDWWFWAIIIFVVATLGYTAYVTIKSGEAIALWGLAFAALLGLGLPLWLAFSTYYLVDHPHLVVRSGPFKWQVDIGSITSIKSSNSPLSSPALSLKRLELKYGNNQSLLISPKDHDAFVAALQNSD